MMSLNELTVMMTLFGVNECRGVVILSILMTPIPLWMDFVEIDGSCIRR